jgi:hypothetical protein
MYPPVQPWRLFAGALVVLLAACADATPLLPPRPVPAGAARQAVECRVNVPRAEMDCAAASAPPGPAADRMVGGQDVYVRLSSSGTGYDSLAMVLRSDVTVENLMSRPLGTPDGSTATGVRVFFHSGPAATGGSGQVTVANADGVSTFTAAEQPYFVYPQILSTYRISSPRTWLFNVPPTVTTFRFVVYVSAAMPDDGAPLLDCVWTGASSAEWQSGGNWQQGAPPDSGSAVSIPGPNLLAGGRMPQLSSDADVMHLRIAAGSSLDLGGHTLRVRGNLDVAGSITGGPVQLIGAEMSIRGPLPSLRIRGRAVQQGVARLRGALSIIDGSLATDGHALSIDIP